jgi:2-keto-3-deoxy-L-rhamnonate aldolase RhmA
VQNRLRSRLRSGGPTLGMWVTLESPTITEIAVALGLDWIVVDTEHGHLDCREVMDHLRAARGTDTAVLVRVPDIQEDLIKRPLDMGAHGILLPLVRSAADVERGFGFARYPPRGVRGIGGERAVRWGLGFQEYLAAANEETVIIPIIETRDAIDQIEPILATPGLEAIFFGPADLSASQGYVGEWEGPGVAEQILRARGLAEARGISAGVLARTSDEAAARADQGFRMVAVGSDTSLLIEALRGRLIRLDQSVEPRLELF